MRRISIWCIALSIGVSGSFGGNFAEANEIDVNGIFSIYRDSNGSPEFIGTGFYIGGGVAVSAAHVFYENGVSRLSSLSEEFIFVSGSNVNQSARYAPTGSYECALHFDDLSDRRDVCFIQLDGQVQESVTEYTLSCPNFLSQPELVVAGYYKSDGNIQRLLPTPTSVQSIIHTTTLVDDLGLEITNGYIQTPFEPQGGLSGAPVFDTSNQVVGVHSGEVDTQWFAPFSGLNSLALASTGKSVFDSEACRSSAEVAALTSECAASGWAEASCSLQGVVDWVIDLHLIALVFDGKDVTVRSLEFRTNNSNRPLSVLNRVQETDLSDEPKLAQIELRILSGAERPQNLGLVDFDVFANQTVETKLDLLDSYYNDSKNNLGEFWGKYMYDATGDVPEESGLRVSGTVSKNTLKNIWSINYNFESLEDPLQPGDTLVTFTEYTYEVDAEKYFADLELERWGTKPRIPVRNAFFTFDANGVDATILPTSFESHTYDDTDSVDEDTYRVASEHSENTGVVFFKNLPSSEGLRAQFVWKN